jgi:hypothetical protein
LGNARYRVRLRDTKGFTGTVATWAVGETEAIIAAKRWFEIQHDLGQVWIEEEAEWISSDRDPGDLGVAESNEAVTHEHLSPQGEILSTKFRVEPEHRRSTRLMRESDRPAWQRLRERLRERGVDPSDGAVADISCTSQIRNTQCGSSCVGSGARSFSIRRRMTRLTSSTRGGSGTRIVPCRQPRRSWTASDWRSTTASAPTISVRR